MDNISGDRFMVIKSSKHTVDNIYLRTVLPIIFEKGMIIFNTEFRR